MDGSHTKRYFLEPQQTLQRRYEALRAIFVDDQPIDRVAQRFGYKPSALKSMASRFRANIRQGVAPPFFSPMVADDLPAQGPAKSDRIPRRPRSPIAAS
jgi:hypothetical protein